MDKTTIVTVHAKITIFKDMLTDTPGNVLNLQIPDSGVYTYDTWLQLLGMHYMMLRLIDKNLNTILLSLN